MHHPPPSWNDDINALNSIQLFLVSTSGPTVFIVKADDMTDTTFKVFIGESQKCSCGGGQAKGKLCQHILFVMIKVLRVPETNPLAWQFSLADIELNRLLDGSFSREEKAVIAKHNFLRKRHGSTRKGRPKVDEEDEKSNNEPRKLVDRKILQNDTICGICQEDMTVEDLERDKLCFCETQCGANFHKRCFRLFAMYNRSNKKPVLCPFCRSKWHTIPNDVSMSNQQMCASTRVFRSYCEICKIKIRSQTFRCASCNPVHDLCKRCFGGLAMNRQPRRYKTCVFLTAYSTNPRIWTPAVPSCTGTIEEVGYLQRRELNDADYDILLSLDDGPSPSIHQHLARVLKTAHFEIAKNQKQLSCAICSDSINEGNIIKSLPCSESHIIHESCLLGYLKQKQETEPYGAAGATCPKCAKDFWIFPTLMKKSKNRYERMSADSTSIHRSKTGHNQKSVLEMNGLVVKGKATGRN
jgi:hypothetical protein